MGGASGFKQDAIVMPAFYSLASRDRKKLFQKDKKLLALNSYFYKLVKKKLCWSKLLVKRKLIVE